MTSPSPAVITSAQAQIVSAQFASRPTFEQVAQTMLEQAIHEKYPSLNIDLSKTQLVTQQQGSKPWTVQPFMRRVLDYLALGLPLELSDTAKRRCFLSDQMPHHLRPANGELDMKVIETLVSELPWTVPIGLEDALTRYWDADTAAGIDISTQTGTHTSRWHWLSTVLRNSLHACGLGQAELSDQAREAVDQVVRWPDHAQRSYYHKDAAVAAYSLEGMVTYGSISKTLASSEILLVHTTAGITVYLLCGAGSGIQHFASLEAFNSHWGERIASQYLVDSIICNRNEIAEDIFDTQAALILNQQLAEARTVALPSQVGLQNLNNLYLELSDPARYLLEAPLPTPKPSERLRPLLPAWVKKASVINQMKFQQYSLALASAKKRHKGRTFLSDIQNIKVFAADALFRHMEQTNNASPLKTQSSQYQPDDIELTFIVATGAPGTAGTIEKTTMSLTELAIKNLVAMPSGRVTLSHRLGLMLPAWLTPELVTRKNGLIEQVDIGATYPRYLEDKFFGDASQTQQRLKMFADELQAQLPLEALKRMLNNENGVTSQGQRLVEAVLKPDAADRQVAGLPVVMRPLAFLRKSGAKPDRVMNMFIIEPQDVKTGPHLLYRPFYEPLLLEFPTRQALLQAIVVSGDLQDSILTWLSAQARAIYANGGLLEPHYVRFGLGDEFGPIDTPRPATLAVDESADEWLDFLQHGKLTQSLYGSNARAWVDQADRASNSNSESRWAVFLEGGSLLFNALVAPFLRGPAMAALWLVNLITTASQDIPALNSSDPVKRELATVDFLLNLGMLAIQPPSGTAPAHAPVSETVKTQTMSSAAPLFVPEQWPAPKPPNILQGPVRLPEYPTASADPLDFSFASAKHRLTPGQHVRLLRLQVPRPAALPEPVRNGTYKGLYVIGNKWHALIEDRLYRVNLELDDRVKVVDPHEPAANGPVLQSDSQGNWSVDLRLRLRGGMPPKRVAEQRRANTLRKEELTRELNELTARQAELRKRKEIAGEVVKRLQEGTYTEAQRRPKRQVFLKLIEEETDGYLKLLNSKAERAGLGIALPPTWDLLTMENIVNNARAAYLLTGWDLDALALEHLQFSAGPALEKAVTDDTLGYVTYLKQMNEINSRAIYWLDLKEHYLEALLDRDAAGAQVFDRLTRDRPLPERNALSHKSLKLVLLEAQAFSNRDSGLFENLESIIAPLMEQVRSHSNLRVYDLSPSEHLEVLTSLTQQYGKALEALEGMKALNADEINEPAFNELIKLANDFYQETSRKLAAEIKPEPQRRKRPPKRIRTGAAGQQKKLIRTRNNGVLIGDLKPAGSSLPIEVVELRNEYDERLLATYSSHEDAWDVVKDARPTPIPGTRPVGMVRGDARKLLGQLEDYLRKAERYKTQCRFPQEIEEIIHNEASRFAKLAAELDRAIGASNAPRTSADETLAKQMSDAIAKLTAKGSALRTELSLNLPPTHGNLQYLLDNRKVRPGIIGSRIAMTGELQDFIQEYGIYEHGNNTPIWYAHFHYKTLNMPKADYSIAHLKTAAQRRESYYSLLAKAESSYAVVDVHRGAIGKTLATQWFLPLAP